MVCTPPISREILILRRWETFQRNFTLERLSTGMVKNGRSK